MSDKLLEYRARWELCAANADFAPSKDMRDAWHTAAESYRLLVELEQQDPIADGIRRWARLRGNTNMDLETEKRHLEQAERHVAEGKGHIKRQRRIIVELRRDGHDTKTAEELLKVLLQTQTTHERMCDRVRARVAGLNPPRSLNPIK
jgi:hypothetical protein